MVKCIETVFFCVFLGPADAALPEEEGAGEQKKHRLPKLCFIGVPNITSCIYLPVSSGETLQPRLPGGAQSDDELAPPVPQPLRGDPGPRQVRSCSWPSAERPPLPLASVALAEISPPTVSEAQLTDEDLYSLYGHNFYFYFFLATFILTTITSCLLISLYYDCS